MQDEPASEEQAADGDFVQSLERGLSVIRAFDADHPKLSLSEVAASYRAEPRRRPPLPAHAGAPGLHAQQRRPVLAAPQILELGYAYLSSLSLPEVAMPHLEELVEQVRESSSVSELDGEDVVYIARVPTKRIMRVTISVGTRFPAYATSMGRVLLAAQPDEWLDEYLASVSLHLPHRAHHHQPRPSCARSCARSADRGWALVDQELEEGLRSLAAPIRDGDGKVIAAVNVSTHAGRRSLDSVLEDLLRPLLATAERIERDLVQLASLRPVPLRFPARLATAPGPPR